MYAVRVGRKTGVFDTWDDTKSYVVGYPGADFRKVKNAAEGEAFLQGPSAGDKRRRSPSRAEDSQEADGTGSEASSVASSSQSKRLRVELPEDRGGARLPFQTKIMDIYTDGSCRSNGTPSAKAGIGVVFSHDRVIDIGAPVPDSQPQTSQRAELLAAYVAILYARRHPQHFASRVRIHTDSTFVIACATEWCHSWKRHGWVKSKDGKPPAHVELIKRIYANLWEDESRRDKPTPRVGPIIEFVKVKAHSGDPGNERADRLAVLGAKREESRSDSD